MANKDSPVKIAVIGAGLIGHRHVQYILEEPRCQLAGVVDPDPQAKALAAKAGAAYYPDIAPFLDEADADGVIIATPNDTHATIGKRCAQAGLHMLVEKPIASVPAEARSLIDSARRAKVRLLVGQHRRFNPYIEATKKILDSGELGTIAGVSALWTLLKPPGYFEAAWRREPGGGPILINLIHDVDNLRYLLGDVTRIYAETSNAIRGFEVEDTAAITLRFQSGVLGTVMLSDAVASPYNFESATGENPLLHCAAQDCYRIFGTKASLSFPDMTLWRYTGGGEQGWAVPITSERIDVEITVPIRRQLSHFCDVIQNDAAPRCSGEEGLKTLEVTQSVAETVRTGAPVSLSPL